MKPTSRDLGLFFFSSGHGGQVNDKYRLLFESARFADDHGFSSVWVPERHFNEFGYLYPNPIVLLAALARETERVALRSGSLILPLHDTVRVAEDLAVVDNLSGGRLGIAIGSGWHPDDFVFYPDRYPRRREEMDEGVETLRRLWRGQTLELRGGDGNAVTVRPYPRPLQPELPIWISAAGREETFVQAGRAGLNVLTHLLLNTPEQLAEKIRLYRRALAESGRDPSHHTVTLWVFTHLGADARAARREAVEGMRRYLHSDGKMLFRGFAYHHTQQQVSLETFSPSEMDAYYNAIIERLEQRGMALFGSPETCRRRMEQLFDLGVDELACQTDFLDPEQARGGLPHLAALRAMAVEGRRATLGVSSEVRVAPAPPAEGPEAAPLRAIRRRLTKRIGNEEFYARVLSSDVEYGPDFRGVEEVFQGSNEALGRIVTPRRLVDQLGDYRFHPALLDACLHVSLMALSSVGAGSVLRLARMGAVQLLGPPTSVTWSHARLKGSNARGRATEHVVDVRVFDEGGEEVARLSGVTLLELPANSARGAEEDVVFELDWLPLAATSLGESDAEARVAARWVLLQPSLDDRVGRALQGLCGPTLEVVPSGSDPKGALPEELLGAGDAARRPLRLIYLSEPRPLTEDTGALDLAEIRRTLALVQDLARKRLHGSGEVSVLVVTRAARRVGEAQRDVDPMQAALWGLVKAAQLEHPEITWQLVDLDSAWMAEDLQPLVAVLRAPPAARALAIRAGALFKESLARSAAAALAPARSEPSRAGTWVVTGGLGALGRRVVRWCAASGATRVAVLGRHIDEDKAAALAADVRAMGVSIDFFAADVADLRALRAVFEQIRAEGPPVAGVVHTAGVLDDGVLLEQSFSRFEAVFAPKVQGSWNLHLLTQSLPEAAFICFSSAAAVYGSPGQSNYAAANAFLGGLAERRAAGGLPALSVDWGPWADEGMAAGLDAQMQARVARYGIRPLEPMRALSLMEAVLGAEPPRARVTVLDADWARVAAQFRRGESPVLTELLAEAAEAPAGVSPLLERLRRASPEERRDTIEAFLTEQVATALGSELDERQRRSSLSELGLDSLLAVDLKNRVLRELGVDIPIVTLMQGATIADLVLAIDAGLPAGAARREEAMAATASSAPPRSTEVATEDLLDRFDELSDAEVKALLEQLASEAA